MNPKVQVLVPSNWSNTDRGQFFEDMVAKVFAQMQYKVIMRVRLTGMEIDILGENLYSKEKAYIECKFLSSPFEAPIISKLIGNAMQRQEVSHAYLVSTAEPGKDAAGTLFEIRNQNNLIRGILRFVFIGPNEFRDLYLTVNQYPTFLERIATFDLKKDSISAATLVITPDESCWVLEQQKSGIPHKAFALPLDSKSNYLKNWEGFESLVAENKVWSGLEIAHGLPGTTPPVTPSNQLRKEVITQVPVADRFDDYNPARPEDFVGRIMLQSDILDFFELVRLNKTKKRVVALSGPSGFGKSSVLLKLADRARNKRYKNKYYIYHIDSRSALSPLFITVALQTAFQKIIKDKFIDAQDLDVEIDSSEDPFSSDSIQFCLKQLQNQQRVLIIFFDQFEELLTKESLFTTFDVMKRVAFYIESLSPNVVLGFSWRTGISFSEDHPAYHMWHSLQEKRAEFKIGLFSRKESLEMINILDKNVKLRLDNTLRNHLLEQAQGFPWFLKKLCIHVYRQLLNNVSQMSLIEQQLNAPLLFEEDTSNLSSYQLSCLKYIAENSPADLVDLQETFGPEVLDFLYENRLLIKSGHKYSVYWDIFREYLLSGDLPKIPMTFLPQASLTTVLSVLRYVIRHNSASVDEIEENFKYTTNTVWNIIGDLYAFFLIRRIDNDRFVSVKEFSETSNLEMAIAEYVTDRLQRHIVLQKLYDAITPNEEISQPELENLIAEVYPSLSEESLHAYFNRLLTWLRFAGCISIAPSGRLVRPIITGNGNEKGQVVIRHSQLIDGQAIFFGTSSPFRVTELAVILCKDGKLSRSAIMGTASRNAAQDLTSLKLAKWNDNILVPVGALEEISFSLKTDARKECADIIKKAALESRFLKSLLNHLSNFSEDISDEKAMQKLADELGRDWHPSSIKRHLGSGLRWLGAYGELQKISGQLNLLELDDGENI